MKKTIIFMVMIMMILSLSVQATVEKVKVSEGEASEEKVMFTGTTSGLSAPPYFINGKETGCDFRDYTGVIIKSYCKGSSMEETVFTMENDKKAYVKVNMIDCKLQTRLSGPDELAPGDSYLAICPKGKICGLIWTEWEPCNLGVKNKITGDVIFAPEICEGTPYLKCVNHKLYSFDACDKPTEYVTCTYGCDSATCKPQPANDNNEPVCGDNMCSPPVEDATTCQVDCGLVVNEPTPMKEVRFPLGLLLLVATFITVGVVIGRRRKK
jgi:hypothetical protein